MYQKHNLVGKGPIHDMLASNYEMEKTVVIKKKKGQRGVRNNGNINE